MAAAYVSKCRRMETNAVVAVVVAAVLPVRKAAEGTAVRPGLVLKRDINPLTGIQKNKKSSWCSREDFFRYFSSENNGYFPKLKNCNPVS